MTEPQLGRLLLAAHRTLAAELVVDLEERGWPDLRASQAALVLNVDRRYGTRLTELARRAGVTKQAMMVVVDELEVRGLVRRTPDPEDGRAKVVRLTARGRTFAAECRRAVAVEARTRRTLGGRRYEGLRETLDLLLETEEDEEEVT